MTVLLAMIGGGPGSFIGPVHRSAMGVDGRLRLVAGAFSRDMARSKAAGAALGVASPRVHGSLDALLKAEREHDNTDRAEAVAIVTPNDAHASQSIAALAAGRAVFCEKPPARTLAETRAVAAAVHATGQVYALAYTYLGYPLVREARARVARGDLGEVRRVAVEYVQGWLAERVEAGDNLQAAWRTDPSRSGPSGCLADIGVHAQSLVEFVTGDLMTAVAADVRIVVAGRQLDDDAVVLFRMTGGAAGTLIASQVCAGARNGLTLRVHGSRGSLAWAQEEPNVLRLGHADGREEIVPAGSDALIDADAKRFTRLPVGHPEGYIEAFANLYGDFATRVRGGDVWLPGIAEGLRSMAFVEAALASSAGGGAWTRIEETAP